MRRERSQCSLLRGWLTAPLLMLIRCYQLLVSPVLGPCCRFLPSCSDYARDAIVAHGALRGTALTLKRLMRCHPFGGSGFDPVPGSGHGSAADDGDGNPRAGGVES